MSLPAPSTQIVASQDTTITADVLSGFRIPAATNTPEAVANVSTAFASVTIWAGRNTQGTPNQNSCYLDWSSGDGTQRIELPVGGFITIEAPVGKYDNLANIYLDVITQGDGVFYRGYR